MISKDLFPCNKEIADANDSNGIHEGICLTVSVGFSRGTALVTVSDCG
jgi:hypothetical protein